VTDSPVSSYVSLCERQHWHKLTRTRWKSISDSNLYFRIIY